MKDGWSNLFAGIVMLAIVLIVFYTGYTKGYSAGYDEGLLFEDDPASEAQIQELIKLLEAEPT